MKFKKFFYKKVNSTNDVAIKKIKSGYKNGIIVSEFQKKGRGQVGKKWVSFKGNLFDSNEVTNSSNLFNTDKFYLLNIWSSWCVPCRKEHVLLMNLRKNKKLEVIGINYKDTKINAENFLAELGNPYKKIIFDKEGINAIEWGAYGVPESFLIKDGIIIKRYIGPLNKKLTKEIKSIIK